MSETEKYKFWKCGGGHVMGMVTRNGSGIRKLMLFRQALYLTPPSPPTLLPGGEGSYEEEIDVMAIVEGYVADVRCSVCGRVRTWVPGEEAMHALLERSQRALLEKAQKTELAR